MKLKYRTPSTMNTNSSFVYYDNADWADIPLFIVCNKDHERIASRLVELWNRAEDVETKTKSFMDELEERDNQCRKDFHDQFLNGKFEAEL